MGKTLNLGSDLAKGLSSKGDRANLDEIQCLIKVINTFGSVVAMHDEFSEELRAIKEFTSSDDSLSLDEIEKEIGKLRKKIFAKETASGGDDGVKLQIDELKGRLHYVSRMIKKIMIPILDNFYPVTDELKAKADSITINTREEMDQAELDRASEGFLSFVSGLKEKIHEDFKYINSTLLTLLDRIKELEATLSKEFGEKTQRKEMEYFELKINTEMGSIVNSFNVHATIKEIKSAVLDKITNIKKLVTKKKKEEMKKSKIAQGTISKLKKKIAEAEKGAEEMSKKAELFQAAATKDGLTELFNRSAFDIKVESVLKEFHEGGDPFSFLLLDIDDFKWINDTFGHLAGDLVLKTVGQCLKETFRKSDFIARYGGDEFAVIINNLSEKMAWEKIQKFREIFKKKRFVAQAHDDSIQVEVSVGIAAALPNERVDELVHRADMAMYESKKKKI